MKYIVEMMLKKSKKKFYLKDNRTYCNDNTYCTSIESAIKFDSRMEGWQMVVAIIETSVSLGVKNENYYRVIGV